MSGSPIIKHVKKGKSEYKTKTPELTAILAAMNEYTKKYKLTVSPASLIPHFAKNTIEFEIHNTVPMFANLFKTYMLSGCEMKCMTFEKHDTDDLYLSAYDPILKAVNMIPIKQQFDYKGVTAKIRVRNKSTEPLDILSSDIVFKRSDDLADRIPVTDICSPNINIATLLPGKFFSATIVFETGFGFDSQRKFQGIAEFGYEQLDRDHTKQSTLTGLASNFKLFFETYTDDSIEYFIKNARKHIKLDLNKFLAELEKVGADDYISDFLTVESKTEYKYLTINIPGQLAACISKYVYEENKDIAYVSGNKLTLNSAKSLIKINSKDYIELLNNAIKKIISDLKIFKTLYKPTS